MSINQKEVEIGNNFVVTIFEYHNERYEMALIHRYKNLNIEDICYDDMEKITGVPDVITVDSQMQVFGMLNRIYSHLKDEYPSMMKNVDGWY